MSSVKNNQSHLLLRLFFSPRIPWQPSLGNSRIHSSPAKMGAQKRWSNVLPRCRSRRPSTRRQNFLFTVRILQRGAQKFRGPRSAPRQRGRPFPQLPQAFHSFPFKRAKSHYQQMKRLFPWRTLQPVRLKKRDHSGKLERQPRNNKKPSGTKKKTWKQPWILWR